MENEEENNYRFKLYSFGSFLLKEANKEQTDIILNKVFNKMITETFPKTFETNRSQQQNDKIIKTYFK